MVNSFDGSGSISSKAEGNNSKFLRMSRKVCFFINQIFINLFDLSNLTAACSLDLVISELLAKYCTCVLSVTGLIFPPIGVTFE